MRRILPAFAAAVDAAYRARTMRHLFRELSCVAALGGFAAAAYAADQPQWGQRHTRNMVSEEKGLPESFDPETGMNVRWAAKLGSQAHGTPIVAGGRVFIGTNNKHPRDPKHEGDRGVLMCFDEKDGSLLWQLIVPKREEDRFLDWPEMGLCSPATVEGDRVYIITNRDELMCLDIDGLADGNDGPYVDEGKRMARQGTPPMQPGKTDADILWAVDLPAEHGVWQHDSPHGSPLIHGEFIYVNSSNGVDNTHRKIRRPDAPGLLVFDKRTGKLAATDGEMIAPRTVHANWSSPSLGTVNERELVFFGGGNGVCYAFDALKPGTNGPTKLSKVWFFDCDPAAPRDNIHQFMGNRQNSASNILGMPVFHKDRIYVAAGGDFWWGKRRSWLKCIDATKAGDITATGQLWSFEMKTHCMSTPAIHDGLLYLSDGGKTVYCLDAETGSLQWTHDAKGDMWASCLVADARVYIGTRRGDFWVLAAGRQHKLLSHVNLGAPISGTATAANGNLYVATMTHLYAVQQERK
jgi:outer membrane protein assembly factor BamB